MSRHETITEIKDLILSPGVRVHMHWIRAHVGHTYNDRADALAKAATTLQLFEVEVKVTRHQVNKHLARAKVPR